MELTQLGMKIYRKHLDNQPNHHCEKGNDNLLGITTMDLKIRHIQHSASLDEVSPKR